MSVTTSSLRTLGDIEVTFLGDPPIDPDAHEIAASDERRDAQGG